MAILFSPIGNSDPWRNSRDGAMLHIVRHYQPEKAILFFTKSIWEGNEKGGHQQYDWEEIIKSVSSETEVEIITEDIENPHDFDAFKEIFHKHLNVLTTTYPNKEILLNVTSGTPQMETTLCLEYVTYPENKKVIQVATPLASSNVNSKYAHHSEAELDIDIVNEEEAEHDSRCKEIEIISFRETILKNQLRALINHYDYEAAHQLLVSNPEFPNRNQLVRKLLRIKDGIKHHKVFDEIANKYKNTDIQKSLFHYLLIRMKFEREDLAEVLIRIKSVEEFLIYTYLNRKYDKLLTKGPKTKIKSSQNEIIKKFIDIGLKNNLPVGTDKPLSLPTYRFLIEALEENELLDQVNKVVKINQLRNNVAHNLDEVNLDGQIRNHIKEAVTAVEQTIKLVFKNVEDKDFDLLEKMNQELIDLL